MARILIVDDEVTYGELLGIVLKDEGHEVAVCESGHQALKTGREFRPEILISDWRLKDSIDGIQVGRILQEQNPNLRLILISGSPSEELRTAAQGLRVFRILEKPCEIDAMCSCIQAAAC
jgi:two-component system, OmpR family, response regulator